MLVVLLMAAVAGRELFRAPLPSGHDAIYALPRAVEFGRALADGQLIPRWAADLEYGFGQPLFNFTPPLVFFLAAAVRATGVGLSAANAGADLLLLTGAGLAMYLLARQFFGINGGLIAAAAYLFAPYFLVTLFVRYALGDFAASTFLPLAMWGVAGFVGRGGVLVWLGATAGIAGLLLSSNHIALVGIPGAMIFALAAGWPDLGRGALARGALALLAGLGMACFYWLPALAERQFIAIDRAIKGVYDYHFHFLYPQQLLFAPWGYGGSVAGPDDGLSLSLGTAQAVLGVLAVAGLPVLWGMARRAALAALGAFVLLGWAILLSSEIAQPVWERISLLAYLQFPWRLLSVGAVALAFALGSLGLLARRFGRRANAIVPLLALVFVAQGAANAVPPPPDYDLPDTLTPQNVADWGLVATNAFEFEPIQVQTRPTAAVPALEFVSGEGEWEATRTTSVAREFVITANQAAQVQLHTFYFPGWTAHIDDVETPIGYDNSRGAMEIEVPSGRHAVRFSFEATPVRRLAEVLSVISGVAVVVFAGFTLGRSSRR